MHTQGPWLPGSSASQAGTSPWPLSFSYRAQGGRCFLIPSQSPWCRVGSPWGRGRLGWLSWVSGRVMGRW